MHDEDSGYVEARRDDVGPFVRLRWGQVRLVTREKAWREFVRAVGEGRYQPVVTVPGWVRAEIDEGFGEGDRPLGWWPKVLEIPDATWFRFVEAVRADVFSSLEPGVWAGDPETAQRFRLTSG
ncbi:MAG: hypothetical protein HOQ38_03810 [Nonomuraea sp.]|nr:hypothetical protein [Nonomuraea sp.]